MPKKYFSFQDRMKQDIKLLTTNEQFLADVQELRNNYGYPKNFKSNGEWDEYVESLDYKNFEKDENILAKKYFIPESHLFEFCRYVESGNFDYDSSSWYMFLHLNPGYIMDNARDEDGIFLKIYPDTSLDNIRESWPIIKLYRDKILNRNIERKVKIENLERDLEILRLKREGKKAIEIRDIINQDDRYKNQKITYQEIPKLIKRLLDMAEKYKFQKRIKPKKVPSKKS